MVGTDSLPAFVKASYENYRAALDATLATMNKELKDQQDKYAANAKNYSEPDRQTAKKNIDDLTQRIEAFRNLAGEELNAKKKECYAMHWQVMLEAAYKLEEIEKYVIERE